MSKQQGTLELVALELSKALQPLKDTLAQGQARILLAELGIFITPEQESTITSALTSGVNAAKSVVDDAKALEQAMEEENEGDVLSTVTSLLSDIQALILSFETLKNGVRSIPGIPGAVIDNLPENLLNYLLADYLDRLEGVSPLLEFLGVLNQEDFNKGSLDPANPPYTISSFDFGKISGWISSPGKQFKALYQWGENDFDGRLLFRKLENILSRMSFPVLYDDTAPVPKLDVVILEAVADAVSHGLAISLKNNLSTGTQTFSDKGWKLDFTLDLQPPVNSKLIIKPDGSLQFIPPDASSSFSGDVTLKLTVTSETPAEPMVILEQTGSSRVEVGEFVLNAGASFVWDGTSQTASGKFKVEGALNKCRVLIDTSQSDSFLLSLLPANVDSKFDLLVGVASDTGFYINGSSTLDIELPLHVQLGPVTLDGLSIVINPSEGELPIGLGANLHGTLGPITVAIADIGLDARFTQAPGNSGELGPFNFDIGFRPPSGVGLSIDSDLVKGGGFLRLDFDKGEYSGALQLSISNKLQVSAIGIINTKLPDGTPGFSLLVIISVQFTPGIALGMGFFLNGLGGMLGINRTINADGLKEGVKNNTIDHILFPENVVANMNTLLPQIKELFPVQQGQFMIGLMAKITWGSPALVSIEFGIVLEMSSPVRLAILGVLKIALPTDDTALLRIQVNFAGVIDFDKSYLAFDALLYNSRILDFTLEGDMALRLSWGATKGFLMSAGGFHPAFKPPRELNVPKLKRITLTILSGNPNMVLTAYFAVTSNTVQFGAKIDFLFKVSEFKVVGFLAFDVLFQFSPFEFTADISAGLAVKMGSTNICSINLDFQLSGPTPWKAKGTASFSILFFTVKVRFNVTWGDVLQLIDPAIAVLPKLIEELTHDGNWTAKLPDNRHHIVTLRSVEPDPGKIILQPFGSVQISQTVLPLNLGIDKFGNNKPLDIQLADITAFNLGGTGMNLEEVREQFAPAAFKTMDDKDKLQSPSYTEEKGGISIKDTNTLAVNYGINRDINYEVKVFDHGEVQNTPPYQLNTDLYRLMTKGGAIAKSPLAVENRQKNFRLDKAAEIAQEQYVIIDNATLTQHAAEVFAGGSQAQAKDKLDAILRDSPSLKGRISIAPAYHLSV